MTRHEILAVVSLLFDPLGFIAPCTMKAKLLLQDLCCKKLGWDSLIDEPEKRQWSHCLKISHSFRILMLKNALNRRIDLEIQIMTWIGLLD